MKTSRVETGSALSRIISRVLTEANMDRCKHDACSQCHGSGVRSDGTACVHMISCSCPRHARVRL